MAKELSQEEVLDFLCQGGGKVPNASLVTHFKHLLRDPHTAAEQLLRRRERFKRYVNSVAVVKPEGAVKYVVLRSRYRDLLGEDLTPANAGEEPAISNNRDQDAIGSDVLHGPQVGGRWSSQPEGSAYGYHRGEPALPDQGAGMTLNDPAWMGNVNGMIHHGYSYTEPYSHDPETRPQQPSSQSPSSSAYSSVPTGQKSPSPLGKTTSPETDTCLPGRDTYQHDNEVVLYSRTFSQQPSDTSLSTTKSDTCILSTKTSASPSESSIPSTKISASPSHTCIPPINISSSPSHISILSTKISASQSHTSISTKTSTSPIHTSISSTKTSASPSDTSITSTKTSASLSHTSIPFTKTSASSSDTFIPSTKTSASPSHTSIPSTSPSDTFIPSTKTSASPSDEFTPSIKTSSAPSNTFIPFNKSTSSSSNDSTKTSEPLSNTSSYSKGYNPDDLSAPYSKDSSSWPSAETPSLSQSTFHCVSEHWRPSPGGDHREETSNPAFVCAKCKGQQELGCTACAELQTPTFDLNGTFTQEVHLKQEDNSNYIKQQRLGFYEELTPSLPSSRYVNCIHPSSSLLLPHESNIALLDMQLEDYQPASPCPSPPLPLNDMHDMWMCQMPVFKSIRCQLSLQDLEDFVDQESCGSEGSDSGEGGDCDTEHKDDDLSNDSNNEKYAQYIEDKCENTRRCPPNRKFLSIIEQYSKLQSGDLLGAKDTLVERELESSGPAESRKSPYIAKSFLTDQAPILFELARQPPKHRASSRFQELMSSSDDELIDRDFRRRRRPSRTKRPPDIVLVPPQPDVDLLLTTKPVTYNKFIVKLADQKDNQAQCVPKANVDFLFRKSFNYKPSTVPLEPAEHDWIVKSASGSWLQVYGLFNQDPQLALRKDFISGYTALHWFAKHGAIEMFHKFVAGAKKAGIDLDFNIKSSGGYTPLHIAAIHGHQKVAAMLVEKLKANVKLRDHSGKRAWQYLNCNTSGEVWRLLGAPKGKTIFASRTLNTTYHLNTPNKSSQIYRKTSLAAFLKPQHQKWKANNHPVLREIYSD